MYTVFQKIQNFMVSMGFGYFHRRWNETDSREIRFSKGSLKVKNSFRYVKQTIFELQGVSENYAFNIF